MVMNSIILISVLLADVSKTWLIIHVANFNIKNTLCSFSPAAILFLPAFLSLSKPPTPFQSFGNAFLFCFQLPEDKPNIFISNEGTIGHNEVLFLSMGLPGSWLQMLCSLCAIISCLIEGNITRQWVSRSSFCISGLFSGTCQSVKGVGVVHTDPRMWCAQACLIWTKMMDN